MKKLIVVIMALITIFSASVTAYAEVFVDWAIVDTILNLQQNSQNCAAVKYNTAVPTPSMVDGTGAIKTQQTTYNVLLSLYETVTVEGPSWGQNIIGGAQFIWYEYGDYCWIKIDPDSTTSTFWVANYQGKILYCEAPASETEYTLSAIAGATGYCITNRPAGTTDSGYLGDLLVTQDNLTTIHGIVANLGGAADYYTVLRIVNGEYRYYIMCTYPNRSQYFVCNTSGQLFYALKDEPEDVSGSTGGTFDATEVITAINSVYNKLDSGFRVVTKGINEANNRITSFNDDFILHMNNTVSGLSVANGTLNTIADYLSGLMNKQIIERTITYSGTDVFIGFDDDIIIADVLANGDDYFFSKQELGALDSNSRYFLRLDDYSSRYYNIVLDDENSPMIVFSEEYSDHGPNPPDSTILYYPFDDSTVNPVVGESTITVTGTEQYAEGVHGQAYVFSENTSALTGVYSTSTQLFNAENGAYTISTWLYPTGSPTSGYFQFRIGGSRYMTIRMGTTGQLDVNYYVSSTSATTVSTGRSLTTNEWNHIAVCYDGETLYIFLNGELCHMAKATVLRPTGDDFKIFSSSSGKVPIGTMIDEFVIVDGAALWTSSFDPYDEAVFSMIKDDYYFSRGFPTLNLFMIGMDGSYSIVGRDLSFSGFVPVDGSANSVPTTMGRIGDVVSYIYYDYERGAWILFDAVTEKLYYSTSDAQLLPSWFYEPSKFYRYTANQLNNNVSFFNRFLNGYYVDIPDGGTITVTYLEYVNWFDSIYSLIDMQSDQLTAIVQKMGNATGDTIINIENTVVDITQNSDAYNIFYVEKTDGTTESVGDAAKDAAVFVGDVLSMFYRLVFDDALDNVGILKDFEGAYSNTEVSVW